MKNKPNKCEKKREKNITKSANNISPRYFSAFIAIFFLFPLSACSATEITTKEKTNPETLRTTITAIEKEISTVIGSASCTSSAQCKALAMGQKACGGPMTYIAYSTQNTDTATLLMLSTQHQQKNKELNQLTGAISNCMMVMQPTFICRDNQCKK